MHNRAQMYTYMCTATSLHLLPFPLSNCPSVRWPTPLLTLALVIVVTIYWTWVNVRWHLLFANVHVNHPSKIFGHFIPTCCLSECIYNCQHNLLWKIISMWLLKTSCIFSNNVSIFFKVKSSYVFLIQLNWEDLCENARLLHTHRSQGYIHGKK